MVITLYKLEKGLSYTQEKPDLLISESNL